ncbi:helix-turn-helix domain-containing protein [Streptococcus suis]|nr:MULTISPECIES: helix-turn-helix transcriptional regulator [Streptococcus]MCG9863907.1 helix-turn-helix domain-containing protein [Streptococcus suis]MCG9865617.1 helix-turn-helix domain-containing protein [Streptococcus suis]MCG9867715.1 helix-turn-helix domain-containing protein [Streptococcus suis]MCG9869889.1 helix-turn-helix domain-containing protein [Streptococcus suis]MCG9903605.1 helix-turn-helix domain-containing protein [Streptococcus suis]
MIGDYLKSLRKRQNIKVVELAKSVGVSQPYVSNIENEKRFPTVELFFKIIISIAELSPLNYEVYFNLDLSDEKKEDIYIPDTLPEFWEKYSSSIIKELNKYRDEDEQEILTLEDFKEYVSTWSLFDMSTFPEYTEFLDSKYGVGGYSEYSNDFDYSSYVNPEYVKTLVVDYWYQDFLTEFISFFENDEIIDRTSKAEYTELMLNSLTEQELEIYSAVKELQHKSGFFDKYQLKAPNQGDTFELNILDEPDVIQKVTLDGKALSSDDIISLQNTLSGIRYKR